MSDVFRTQDSSTSLRTTHPDLAELYPRSARPTLRTVWISAINGVVPVSASGNIGNDTDFALLQHLRHCSDAVLVSRRTAIAEKYQPIAALASEDRPPLLVVLARSPLPDEPADYQGPHVLDAVLGDDRIEFYRERELRWTAPSGPTPLVGMLDALRARGYRALTCEGGPSIFTQLLAADVVDEICATIAPFVAVGGDSTAATPSQLHRFTLDSSAAVEGYLYTRWSRDRRHDDD